MSIPDSNPSSTSFEEALQSLQQIVGELEGGTIPLDTSLQRFEEGIGLLRQCYQFLDRAEQKIEQLVSLDANGNCVLVPFDSTATLEKQQTRTPTIPVGKKSNRPKSEVNPDSPEISATSTDKPIDSNVDSASESTSGKLLF